MGLHPNVRAAGPRVIPVLDLLQGQVVHAVAGNRSAYLPIRTPLCAGSRPLDVALALRQRFGSREFYLADLDAIEGAAKNWNVYADLLRADLTLWVDAGPHGACFARELADFTVEQRSLARIVAGLESVLEPRELARMLEAVGPERLAFSLDLKHGVPWTDSPGWQRNSALDIASTVLALGIRRMIVLDLARVGTGEGVGTEALCLAIRDLAPDVELIAGGGIRGPADLRALSACACDAALVASALHNGRLRPEDLVH